MIVIQSRMHLAGISATQLTDWMLNPTDVQYQAWWPGTHLQFHTLESRPGHIGDVIMMNEYVGRRRVKMNGVVTEAVPGKKVVWQFKQGVRLPAHLVLEVADEVGGVALTHTLQAGFGGLGRILDPLLRLYFSPEFERDMDEHAQAEFPMLAAMLRGDAGKQV